MNFNKTTPKVPPQQQPVFQSLVHSSGGKSTTARVTDFAGALKGASTFAGTDTSPKEGLGRLLNGGGTSIPSNYKRV